MAVRSMKDSSSEVSATVKSDRVAILMGGEWVAGVMGSARVSGAATGSGGGGRG